MFGENSFQRDCVHSIGLLGEAVQHQKQYVKNFEARGVEFRRYAQANANMLVFDALQEPRNFRRLADPRVAHEERLERQRAVGLLQLKRKAGYCILAAHLVDLWTVVLLELFRLDQRLGPQRKIQVIKLRRGAFGSGKHTQG